MRLTRYHIILFLILGTAILSGIVFRNNSYIVIVILNIAAFGLVFYLVFNSDSPTERKDQKESEKRERPTIEESALKDTELQKDTTSVDYSVLGADFSRNMLMSIEKSVDFILDDLMKLLHAHLKAHTVAVFFPEETTGYMLRKNVSESSSSIIKNAVIYEGMGHIGSGLKDKSFRFRRNEITSNSKTLYIYSRNVGVRSLICSPIIAENTPRGFIIADRTSETPFTDHEHSFLDTAGTLCGRSVYYAYLYSQHRIDHIRLNAMSSVEKIFFRKHKLNEIIEEMTNIIPFAFPCDRLTISLKKDEDTASVIKSWGKMGEDMENLSFSTSGKTLAGIVYSKNTPIFRNLSQKKYEYRYDMSETPRGVFRSFLAYPLGVNGCMGMILMESLEPDIYMEKNLNLMQRFATSASMAIEKMRMLEKTEKLATKDGLTGLYNHRQFQQLLEDSLRRAKRSGKSLSLTIADIDHFKNINDTYGHRFGDSVLKKISQKLESEIRRGVDHTARYGGEEFALILNETGLERAMDTIERIRSHISSISFTAPNGKIIKLTMSFGIATYGVHAKEQENLIKRADKALYKAKENGRDRVEVYFMPDETEENTKQDTEA